LGGRLGAFLYCADCNSGFGAGIDAELSKQFGKIATLLDIQRTRGKAQSFDVKEVSTGTDLIFDGKGLTRKNIVVRVSSKDGENLDAADVTARTEGELNEIISSVRKRYIVSEEVTTFVEHHPGPTEAVHETEINTRLIRRAAAKIAYSYTCSRIPDRMALCPAFDGMRAYIRNDEGPDLAHVNYVHTQFMTDHVRLLHKIHVAFDRSEGIIVGYVSLFGMFRYTVLLAEDFESQLEWADLDYTFDPVRREEVFGHDLFRAPPIVKMDILNPKQAVEFVQAEIDNGFNLIADYVSGYEFLRGELS
jgi:hypothetical protein